MILIFSGGIPRRKAKQANDPKQGNATAAVHVALTIWRFSAGHLQSAPALFDDGACVLPSQPCRIHQLHLQKQAQQFLATLQRLQPHPVPEHMVIHQPNRFSSTLLSSTASIAVMLTGASASDALVTCVASASRSRCNV